MTRVMKKQNKFLASALLDPLFVTSRTEATYCLLKLLHSFIEERK
jgi:hypothetical protein